MIRNFLNEAVQKKFFLMFFTCVIYIVGLFAYFNDNAILSAFLLLILGVFSILKNYLSPKLVLFWYFMFFFAFFNASFKVKNFDALYQIAPQEVTLQGQIVSIPNKSNSRTRFFFNVQGILADGKIKKTEAKTLVTFENSNNSNLNIGNYYEIKGKLRTPFKATNPSQFDYTKYLKNFNIFTTFYAQGQNCKELNHELSPKWHFLQGLNNVRNDIIQSHAKCLKSPNLELLGGVVFGDDAISPPDSLKQSFANSGLLHILAASGMNVALIYGIWFFILRKLKAPFNLSVASGIFVVIFYTMMTGLGPSIIRAAIMLIFILIGKLIDRDADSLSLLSFVALLMLIYNPSYINDVGFQLSFVVTFGLLIMSPIVFERVKVIPGWLSGVIFVPIIAQIWVAPIQMFYFNSFSLYSVFANILVLPFLTVISFGGFISAVLALIKPISDKVCLVFDFVLNPMLNCLVGISDYFAKLPHSLLQIPQPSVFQIVLYYSIILMIVLFVKHELSKKIATLIIICFILLVVSCLHLPNKKLEIIAFDVQNADSFLIKTPQNKYFLIDSAKQGYKGGKSQAKFIILEYLKDNGIKNIEALILTHFDSDHAGGAVDLIEKLNIKTIYVNSLEDKSKIAQNIYKKGFKKIKLAKINETIYTEGDLSVRNFVSGFQGEEFENENSIITLVSNNNFDILFMGDAGVLAFNKIKNNLPNKIEVLKVGHHGAKNVVDKEFLDKINPDYAIVSTGINNYGHPNGVTLDLLDSHNVKVLRTDKNNAIKIENKDEDYNIYSFDKKWEVVK